MARKTARVSALDYTATDWDTTPTWVGVDKRDLTITATAEAVDLSASEKVNTYGHGPIDLRVSGTIPTDHGNAAYDALQAAHAAGTVLGFRALDADVAGGGKGWHFNGIITRFDQGGGRSDANLTQLEIVPSPLASGTDPAYQAAT